MFEERFINKQAASRSSDERGPGAAAAAPVEEGGWTKDNGGAADSDMEAPQHTFTGAFRQQLDLVILQRAVCKAFSNRHSSPHYTAWLPCVD